MGGWIADEFPLHARALSLLIVAIARSAVRCRVFLLTLVWQRRYRPVISNQVPNGEDGVSEQHAWAGPAHHDPDFFTHLCAVTMHHALGAVGFGVAKHTALQTALGVVEQLGAVGA